MKQLALGIAACLCLSVALPAATVSFGSDLENEWNSVTGANVTIRPHAAWASLEPWQWISYGNTGTGAGAVSPPNSAGPGRPTASFFEALPDKAYFVRLTVFADDTAAVYLFDLDHPAGLLLAPANWRQDGACAAGPIGCQPGEGLLLEFAVNRFGPALLRFDVFQRGRGPFGLLYGGASRDRAHIGGGNHPAGGCRAWMAVVAGAQSANRIAAPSGGEFTCDQVMRTADLRRSSPRRALSRSTPAGLGAI